MNATPRIVQTIVSVQRGSAAGEKASRPEPLARAITFARDRHSSPTSTFRCRTALQHFSSAIRPRLAYMFDVRRPDCSLRSSLSSAETERARVKKRPRLRSSLQANTPLLSIRGSCRRAKGSWADGPTTLFAPSALIWLQARGETGFALSTPRNGNRSTRLPQTLRLALRAAH